METPDIKTSSYTSRPMLMFTKTGGMELAQETMGAVEQWDPEREDWLQRFEAAQAQQDFVVIQESSESSEPTGPSGSSSSPSSDTSTSTESTMDRRRLVQVFIVDPDDELPLEHALLYSGEQQLTDLTNQELFFEIDIKTIMDKHNKVREKTIDKDTTKVSGKKSFLDPVRIRDLKMTVVEVAVF